MSGPYQAYQQSSHYPQHTQYPQSTPAFYHTHSVPPAAVPPPKPPSPPAPPDLSSSVTPQIASRTTQRLISIELKDAGFDSVQTAALQRLELEVTASVERLYQRAHEYANLANRAGPIIADLLMACEEAKLDLPSLRRLAISKSSRRKKRDRANKPGAPILLPPRSRSPSPEMLTSDDEDGQISTPATLRNLPLQFPTLPPKHAYMTTPPSPPKKQALPSLQKKLETATLVQSSLKNLLIATEETENQEEAELLGHIVNWETNVHPRKKWKVSS